MQSENYRGLTILYEEGQYDKYLTQKARIEKIVESCEDYSQRYRYKNDYVIPLGYNKDNVLTLYMHDGKIDLGLFDVRACEIKRQCKLNDTEKVIDSTVKKMDIRAENIARRNLCMNKKEPALAAWEKEIKLTPKSICDIPLDERFEQAIAESKADIATGKVNQIEKNIEEIMEI